jgi:NitT/TauT family transport system substrate-binding protein
MMNARSCLGHIFPALAAGGGIGDAAGMKLAQLFAAGAGRRALLALPGLLLAGAAAAAMVRLGLVQFGTAQWLAAVMRRHRLDAAHGVALQTAVLANTDAGRVALMAGSADVVVTDWPFAAAQRAAGTPLCFSPFSTALGGVMVPAASPIRGLADLTGKHLGVAGGPLDKSWLLVKAAAKQSAGIDLASVAHVAYGAPPLLDAKLMQGELDAVLTFWTFAARLEAAGYREATSVADCAALLGLPRTLPLVGFVFHESWARANRDAIDGFLAAVSDAERIMASSDAEWDALRPLMNAPDAALAEALKRRFLAGIASSPTAAEQKRVAAGVLEVLLRTGGPRAAAGLKTLPEGLFWDRTGARA